MDENIKKIDDPKITLERTSIIKKKKFLYKVYLKWYDFLLKRLHTLPEGGKLVEIGSGAGFLKELIPEIITSDIIPVPTNDMTFSAEDMPFEDNSLSVIFMIDVLHHIPNCRNFFAEAQRTLKPGGKIIMSEPANTIFSRFIYQNFHHEPFDPKAGWEIKNSSGPLSGANGAIPWIVFKRDLNEFQSNYPNLKVTEHKLHTPLLFTLSGGFSKKSYVPFWSFNFFKWLDQLLGPLNSLLAMFQLIIIEKTE